MKPKLLVCRILFLLCTCVQLNAVEDFRDFTDKSGKVIHAKLSDATATSVDLVMENGRKFNNVSISLFCEEDQNYIKIWLRRKEEQRSVLTSDARIEIKVALYRDKDKNNYGDIDDEIVQLSPNVEIKNRSFDTHY